MTQPVRRPARSPRGFHGWRIVRTFAVAQTVSWGILYYSFTVLLLPMQRDLGVSLAALTGAFSVAVVAAGIAAVPVGRWLDRHGGRALMSLGGLAGALLVLTWSQVETVAGLYLTFAGIGVVSAAVLYDPAFAVVVRWFRRDRARALLAITLVAGFASTIFTPLTAALEQSLGWRHTLWVLAGVLAAATVVPYAVVLRRDPADLGQHPDGEPVSPDPDAEPADPGPGGGHRTSLRATARWVGRDRRFWLLATAYTAQSLGIVILAVHLVPMLVDAGHSVGFAAVATGALGALSVAGRVTVTGAVGRWHTSRVTATVFAVQAVGCLLLLAAGSTTVGAVGFVLLFGIGFGVGTITRPALVADAFGTATFATVSALLGIALTAAKATGPVAAGLLHATVGGYGAVLLLTTGSFAVAAAAVWASGVPARTVPTTVRETTAA